MNIFVAGGGGRNLVVLGALYYLFAHRRVPRVNKAWGISSGSVIAAGFALRMHPLDLFKRLDEHAHLLSGVPNIRAFVRAIFPQCPPPEVHHRLAILVYDAIEDQIVKRNAPDYFYESIEESCGIPPVTAPYDARFVDAGIVDNIPFHLAPVDEPTILLMSKVVGETPLSWSFWLNVSGRRKPVRVPPLHSLFVIATPNYAFLAQTHIERIALFMIGFTQMARAFKRACVNE